MIITIILILYFTFFINKIAKSLKYGLFPLFLVAFYDSIVYYTSFIKTSGSFSLGGLTVTPHDVAFAFFLFIGYKRLNENLNNYSISTETKLLFWVYLYAIICIPFFAIYLGTNFIGSINAGRTYILFLPVGLYFYTFKFNAIQKYKFLNLIYGFLIFVAAYTVYLFMIYGLADRVIISGGTIIMLYGFLLFWIQYMQKNKLKDAILALSLFLLVIILRHRSVWIALASSIIYVLFYVGMRQYMIKIVISIIALFFISTMMLPDTFKEKVTNLIVLSAADLTSKEDFETSTGGGRISRWKAIFQKSYDHSVLIVGKGHYYDRRIKFKRKSDGLTAYSEVSFHNNYLEHMFRMGAISLFMLLIALVILLYKIHISLKKENNLDLLFVGAATIATMAYGMAYSFHWSFIIIVAIGLSVLDQQKINSNANQ